jgi:DNA-binding NarL/FixJ family response regulator
MVDYLGAGYRLLVGQGNDAEIQILTESEIGRIPTLRRNNPHAFMLVLGHADPSLAVDALEAGADDYVSSDYVAEVAAHVVALARRLPRRRHQ